jgi:PAS domain S-box-containing protein
MNVQELENITGSGGGVSCVEILHLEDSLEDSELILGIMEKEGLPCKVTLISQQTLFEEELEKRPFDLILCDHGIPGYNGFTALRFARKRRPDIPVIMLSGSLDDAQAVESLKAGATDYILKQRLARLVPAIRRALREAKEQKKQQESDERIREQANLLNLTGDAIIVRNLNDQIVFWNKGASLLFGWNEEEATGQDFGELLMGDSTALAEAKARLIEFDEWMGEFHLKNRAGEEIIVFSRWNLLRSSGGQVQAILSANTDITEKKKLEGILLRAQRMDSIGALAGGIAHDLNNALAPVLMSAEILRSCDDNAGREKFLDIITSSAQRAAGMVKQILGFARGKSGGGPVSVGAVVREMVKIVKDTFPKSISISMKLTDRDLWQIQGDATELHQVLLNLCVNARDAMPDGGQLTLSVQNVRLTQEEAAPLQVAAGPWVLLSVADTGSGIPPEVLPHIFEPFYTTKLPDKGTGLGLSTLAGIVKHHGGCIDIKTGLGKGTEFKIYLPAIDTPAAKAAAAGEAALPSGHGELILVMDDEEAVRELTKAALESYGYTVVTAENGVHGIACFEAYKDKIRAVVSDTDMPVMDGMTAIRAIKKIRPDVPIILASGGKRDTEEWQRIDSEHLSRLGKPYNLEQLLFAIATVIPS